MQVTIDRGTSTYLGMLDIFCDDHYITTAQVRSTRHRALGMRRVPVHSLPMPSVCRCPNTALLPNMATASLIRPSSLIWPPPP